MVTSSGAAMAYAQYPASLMLNAQVAAVNNAIANASTIGGGTMQVVDGVSGATIPFQIQAGGLTVAESNTIFTAMLSILQARQTVLNAAIAAIS